MANPWRSIEQIRWFYRAWRYRLRVEPAEIRCLLEHLGPGDTVVDIGAHKGGFTYWMRQAVGEAGLVFAFEPQPRLAGRLSRLVSSDRYGNVVVENLGLSSSAGSMMLHLPGNATSPSASFEATSSVRRPAGSIEVDATTLDAYFLDSPARSRLRIRLIKCDAEGHELEVFSGGARLLRDQRPDLLFECEARHRRSGTVSEVFDFLAGLGYRGWYVHAQGLEPVERFDLTVHQSDPASASYVNNFFFRNPESGRGAGPCA